MVRVSVLMIAAMLVPTICAGQTVTYDYDRATDFSAFKTYAWVRGTELDDAINHKRIVDAIEELAAKGLAKVDSTAVDSSATPVLLVAYHASFGRDLRIEGFSSGWGGYRFGGARSASARVNKILTGTLLVDMVNAKSRTIVWRGIASKEIDVKASPEKRERNIRNAVAKIFRNYPPKK